MTAALLLAIALLPGPAQGGMCWVQSVHSGRCKDLLREKVTKEECCASSSVSTAWSSEDLDAERLFFWRSLGGGVHCRPCKDSCKGVQCGEGHKCVLKRGQPKCVCAPDCRGSTRHKGPVCGTDGRTYRSACRLRKRVCRRKLPSLSIAYNGQCQRSCSTVRCPADKQCLLDQNKRTHCVRCENVCPARSQGSQHVCGVDGVTYPSSCHLREAACHKGKAIPQAYKGHCKRNRGITDRASTTAQIRQRSIGGDQSGCLMQQCAMSQATVVPHRALLERAALCHVQSPLPQRCIVKRHRRSHLRHQQHHV